MNVIGIVAEYNPFHNGHVYQINKVKEMYPLSVIVVALSSHYTERGDISVLSKWDKTRIALEMGADIVLEIPFVFSNQSADIFSYAAIKMLSEFNIDTLVFGSECNDKEKLIKIASAQIDNPKFDELVKLYISEGYNYPTSLSKAIYDLTHEHVQESNDLLAVSYIKEIIRNKLDIKIVPIKRTNSFLDIESDEEIISAGNIRNRLKDGQDISKYVPSMVCDYVRKVDYEELFNLIRYKIISEKDNLGKYHLIDEGLENRIYESAIKSKSMNELLENIKTKRYTYNKINRTLINIFVGFTKAEASKFKRLEYIRILGFTDKGREYFKSIKDKIKVPVINKFEKYDMLELELKVTALYALIVHDVSLIEDEIKRHTIIC